jgi:hypothetical protein
MRTIFRSVFGSRLYGTNTPTSDEDFKSIFIPDARDIVLRRGKQAINRQRPKGIGEKNYAGEQEEEAFSLQKYLELLSEGQTVALDILFTPEQYIIGEPSPEWFEIVANKDKLITRQASSFVGYCRQQASKYGVKGARLAAAKGALDLIESIQDDLGSGSGKNKLQDFEESLILETNRHPEYMEFVMIDQPNSDPINHWSVCGRKLPFNTSLKNAHGVLYKLVSDYGSRTIQAEKDGGIDWKALSHSVRIANQAIELLSTGKITFPLPNADYIRSIKTGKVPYKVVGEEIEDLLEKVEAGMLTSVLPEAPDKEWIDNFVFKVYKEEIFNDSKQ